MKIHVLPHILAHPRRPAERYGLSVTAAVICLAACAQPQDPLTAEPGGRSVPAVTPSRAGCPAGEAAEMVWPQLSDLQPRPVAAGSEVTVTASGDYVTCGASGVNESARRFQVDLDGLSVGSISCYINHCKGNFALPANTAAGAHMLAAEGGSRLSLIVTAR